MNTPTKRNSETYETFYSTIKKKTLVEYNYRDINGELHTCIDNSLDLCRNKIYKKLGKVN